MQHPFRLASIAMVILFSVFIFVSQQRNKPIAYQEQNQLVANQPLSMNQTEKWMAYDAGLKLAKAQQKPVFVEFFATWCGYCKKMDKEVFSNPEIQQLLKQYFVAARVTESSENQVMHDNQAVTEKKLTSIYGVTGFPTLMFLDSEGKEIAKLPGFIGAEEMTLVLKFIGTKAYQDMDFPTFKKERA